MWEEIGKSSEEFGKIEKTENNKVKIHSIVDSNKNKQGKFINNIKIKSPNEIKNTNHSIVIASTIFYRDIYDKIINMGIKRNRIMSSLFF